MKLKSTAWLVAALMCCVSIVGVAGPPPGGLFVQVLRLSIEEEPNFLADMVPTTFGDWTIAAERGSQIIVPATDELLKTISKETLSRTYVNKAGYKVMLSMARIGNQIGIQQAPYLEICPPAIDYEIGQLVTAFGPINVWSMIARDELHTCWATMGDWSVRSKWIKAVVRVLGLITGESPGVLLSRISSIDQDSVRAFTMHQKFVAEMMDSVTPEGRRKLGGLKSPNPV